MLIILALDFFVKARDYPVIMLPGQFGSLTV